MTIPFPRSRPEQHLPGAKLARSRLKREVVGVDGIKREDNSWRIAYFEDALPSAELLEALKTFPEGWVNFDPVAIRYNEGHTGYYIDRINSPRFFIKRMTDTHNNRDFNLRTLFRARESPFVQLGIYKKVEELLANFEGLQQALIERGFESFELISPLAGLTTSRSERETYMIFPFVRASRLSEKRITNSIIRLIYDYLKSFNIYALDLKHYQFLVRFNPLTNKPILCLIDLERYGWISPDKLKQ